MAILYIRDLDERTMTVLKERATQKKISTTNLARTILNQYAAMPEVLSIEEKYRHFTEDLMGIYQTNMEELKSMTEKNMILLEELENVLEEFHQHS